MFHDDELLEVCFKDIGWLNNNKLDNSSVLDYFSLSQFYDKTCNNEVVKMQTERKLSYKEIQEKLTHLIGIEYFLFSSTEDCFIIGKQERKRENLELLCFYYVLNGVIYQAPTIKEILLSRLEAAMWFLNQATILICNSF